jgi:hypothetical protein
MEAAEAPVPGDLDRWHGRDLGEQCLDGGQLGGHDADPALEWRVLEARAEPEPWIASGSGSRDRDVGSERLGSRLDRSQRRVVRHGDPAREWREVDPGSEPESRRLCIPQFGGGYLGRQRMGGTDGYTGVAVTSPRLAWAVGSAISSHITRSVIIRWNGKTWQQVSAPNPDASGRSTDKPAVHENLSRIDITISMTGDDGGSARLGEADVQEEVPEPQVECSAAGPVHDEGQQDDGQDYHDHPEEEHDDAGDGTPGYSSSSSHGRQLPTAVRLIRRQGVSGMLDRPNLRPDDNLHPPRSGALRAIRCLVWHGLV